jgi:S1-C subfamily serine protease
MKLRTVQIGASLAILSCLYPLRTNGDEKTRAIINRVNGSTAALTGFNGTKTSRGTGFLRKNDVLITNAHVLKDVKGLFASFDGIANIPCELIDVAEDYDLAAVKLKTTQSMPPVELPIDRRYEPKRDDEVILIGNPYNFRGTSHRGRVSNEVRTLGELIQGGNGKYNAKQLGQRVIQLNIDSTHGFSGAPVIDLDGRVIGVQTAGLADGQFGIQFCIPHYYITDVLNLDKPSRPIEGAVLREDFGYAGLGKQHSLVVNNPDPNNPGDAPGQLAQVDVTMRNWGFVDSNPQTIYESFVEDKPRFLKMMTYNTARELLQANRVVNAFNPSFRFSILIPENYRLEQTYLRDEGLYIATIINDDPNVPRPLNSVRIHAWKIRDVIMEDLARQFPHPADRLKKALELLAFSFPKEANFKPTLTEI